MDIKQFDVRVRYHVRRFEAKTPLNVLRRYEQRLQMSHDTSELQRHAFHVASWVVELSPKQMSHQYDENLSAVLLLGRYLKTLQKEKGTPLSHQLLKLLDRVWEPVRANLHEEVWASLANHLRHHVPEPDGAELDIADDKWTADMSFLQDGTKAARLMNKSIQIWRNQTCPKTKESYVVSLEESLAETGIDNPQQIRSIFRRAVAALSPPRLINTSEQDRVRAAQTTSQDFQGRLRKIVCWCLDRLDLADPKIKPALLLLQSLLQRFQELLASPTQGEIGCKKHWLRLQALVSKCGRAGGEVPSTKRLRSKCEHGAEWQKCGICRPCPHGKAKRLCVICSGCPHGKVKQYCIKCSGCPHGKSFKSVCLQCSPCPHGRVKKSCMQCSPCIHGKLKRNCGLCNPCLHGKNKYQCRLCKQHRSGEDLPKKLWGEESWRDNVCFLDLAGACSTHFRVEFLKAIKPKACFIIWD